METTTQQLEDIALLVEHGDLDRAQAQTHELLLLYPNSAAAHALMGDIAAARREPREAVDWYELSLRLQQDPAVAVRLNRQRELLNRQAEDEIDELLERPRDNRRLLMAGIIGGFVVVALLVIIFASTAHRKGPSHSGRPMAGAPLRGRPQPGVPATPPGVTQGLPTPGAGGRPSTGAQPRPSIAAGPTPAVDASGRPINVTQSVDAPMSNRDRLLTRALSGITWPTGEALGWRVQAVMDDFTGYALITAELPRSLRTADLSGTVIDMSYKLAVAAIQADKGVSSLTVRVLTDVEVDNKNVSMLAFRGNTTRDHLDYYLKRGMQPDRQTVWEHVFATTWWNPTVPAGQEAPAS